MNSYDSHALPLLPLNLGAHVKVKGPVIKRLDKVSVVMRVSKSRDYIVTTPSRRILWRNHCYLRAVPEQAAVHDGTRDESPLHPKADKTDDTGHASARQRRRREIE